MLNKLGQCLPAQYQPWPGTNLKRPLFERPLEANYCLYPSTQEAALLRIRAGISRFLSIIADLLKVYPPEGSGGLY